MEQQDILQAVSEGLNFPIYALDREYRYTHFNQAHAAVMKALYDADIQLGHPLFDYQSREDWQIAKQNLDRALQGESLVDSAFSGEARHSRRYFQISHKPIRDPKNKVVGVAVMARDITEQEQAVEALRLSEQRFRRLIESSIDAVTLLDADGTVRYDSPSAPRLLGYSKEEWIGRSALDLIHPDDLPEAQALLREVATNPGSRIEHIFRLHHKDG